MRRRRRSVDDSDFQDPLKNYETPAYNDDLDRSLMEGEIRDIKITPFTAVLPETTIQEALTEMRDSSIACLLIARDGKLLGIFSVRDVLNRVVDNYDRIMNDQVSDVMTPNPTAVYRTDSPAKALNLMADSGFRHLPILNVDEKVVGILGPRRGTSYLRKFLPD